MLLSELPCRIKGDAADATIPWHLLPSEVIGHDPEGGAEGKCRPERHFHQNRFLGAGKSCVEHGCYQASLAWSKTASAGIWSGLIRINRSSPEQGLISGKFAERIRTSSVGKQEMRNRPGRLATSTR